MHVNRQVYLQTVKVKRVPTCQLKRWDVPLELGGQMINGIRDSTVCSFVGLIYSYIG